MGGPGDSDGALLDDCLLQSSHTGCNTQAPGNASSNMDFLGFFDRKEPHQSSKHGKSTQVPIMLFLHLMGKQPCGVLSMSWGHHTGLRRDLWRMSGFPSLS